MDGDGGVSVFSEKMKKDRMRKLSVVSGENSSKENGEMGGCAGGSNGENELRSRTGISKRFKLPKKFSYDSNPVDHASVPRKLRSAMKKRNHESVSPPLLDKKPNHGSNGVKKDGVKRSRLNQQGDMEGSPSRPVSGPITKDEEEVVETLYALADMFPSNTEKNSLDGKSMKAKSWPLPDGQNLKPALEAPEKKEGSKPHCPLDTAKEGSLKGSAQETVEFKCSDGPSQPGFPKTVQFHAELDDAISQRNIQAMSQSELSLRTGSSRQPKHEEAVACASKPQIEAAAVSGQHGLHYMLNENENSGSALWPGLFSAGSQNFGTKGSPLQSSSDMIPAWLGTAASATPHGSLVNGAFTKKDSRGPVARKTSWKRCSAHVHISRLIKVLQIAEKTDMLPPQPTQLTSNEGTKLGIPLANNLNGVRNGLNGAVSALSIVGSAAGTSTNEVRGSILLHSRLLQEHQLASTKSDLYTSQKQIFDFLSLSTGGGGVEDSNSCGREGKGLEPLMPFHIPYVQSLAHTPTIMPFCLPENHFTSTPSNYRLSVAEAKQIQIQPPSYPGSPLLGPHLGTTASPKLQQRWIWTTQLAAQYQPTGLPASHFPNWQNGRQDPSSAIQYTQSVPQPLHSSLEVLGPKYAPISQQQQHLYAVTSSLAAVKSRRHHLPSGYEGNGIGTYPDTARPLQLLCNEHL